MTPTIEVHWNNLNRLWVDAKVHWMEFFHKQGILKLVQIQTILILINPDSLPRLINHHQFKKSLTHTINYIMLEQSQSLVFQTMKFTTTCRKNHISKYTKLPSQKKTKLRTTSWMTTWKSMARNQLQVNIRLSSIGLTISKTGANSSNSLRSHLQSQWS